LGSAASLHAQSANAYNTGDNQWPYVYKTEGYGLTSSNIKANLTLNGVASNSQELQELGGSKPAQAGAGTYQPIVNSVNSIFSNMRSSLQSEVSGYVQKYIAPHTPVASIETSLTGPMNFAISNGNVDITGLHIGMSLTIIKDASVAIFPVKITCTIKASSGPGMALRGSINLATGSISNLALSDDGFTQSVSCSSSSILDIIPFLGGIINSSAEAAFSAGIGNGLQQLASADLSAFQGISFAQLNQTIPAGTFVINGIDVGTYLKGNLPKLLESGPVNVLYTEDAAVPYPSYSVFACNGANTPNNPTVVAEAASLSSTTPYPISLGRGSNLPSNVTSTVDVLSISFPNAGLSFSLQHNYVFNAQPNTAQNEYCPVQVKVCTGSGRSTSCSMQDAPSVSTPPSQAPGQSAIPAGTVFAESVPVQVGTAAQDTYLVMQDDGNLVLYKSGVALWNSQTEGQNCGNNRCEAIFQTDGNFVVYNAGTAIWAATWGGPDTVLLLSESAPYISLLSPSGATWTSSQAPALNRR
jgi:hypothetical protein